MASPERNGRSWPLLLTGLIVVLLVTGRALFPDRTFLPLDLLHEAFLPWANDVHYPKFADHYTVDAVQEYLPMYSFYRTQLMNGKFPTWNPYNRGGSPYLDNPVRLPFNPAHFLLLWISIDQLVDILAILHFSLAFFSMMLYLRSRGLRSPAAFLGGLSYTFSSYFVLNILHERNVASLALLPLALLFLDKVTASTRWRDVAILSVVLGLMLLVAGPAAIFMMLLVFGVRLAGLIVCESTGFGGASFARLVIAGLLACFIAAPSLLSMLHGLAHNIRSFDYSGSYSVAPTAFASVGGYVGLLVSAIHPYILGSRDSLDALKPFNQTIRLMPFAGSFALIFVLFSCKRLWREAGNRWLVILLALGLFLLWPYFVNILSQRSVFLLLFFIVVASAIGFEEFWSADRETLRRPAMWLLITAALAWVMFGLMELAIDFFGPSITDAIERVIRKQLAGYMFERYAEWKLGAAERFVALHRIVEMPNLLFLLGITVFALSTYLFSRSGKQGFKIIVLIVAAASPVLFALDNLFFIDNRIYPIPKEPSYLRLVTTGVEKRRTWFANINEHDRLLMPKNLPDMYGIRQVQGYGSLIPINPAILLQRLPLEHPLFEVAGVSYLATARDSDFHSPAFPRRLYSGEMNIYGRVTPASRFHVTGRLLRVGSREAALQRARSDTRPLGERYHYVTSLPKGYSEHGGVRSEIFVKSDGVRRIELTAKVDASSLLLLADTWYPGWRAFVNGRPVDILSVDGALRGVWLGAGSNQVIFEYHHWPSRIGFIASVLGVAFLLIVAILAALRPGNIRRRVKFSTFLGIRRRYN